MIIDGKKISSQIQQEIQQEINQVTGRRPCLAVILVGEHPPSQIYIKRKTEACESIGMLSLKRHFPVDCPEATLIQELERLNHNPHVDGILIQLPLPPHLDPVHIIAHLSPDKDVDGLHPLNAGKLLIGDPLGFVPCTPLGIKVLLERSKIEVEGKHVVILGRSNLVGKPLAVLLVQNQPGANATVSLAHRYSQHLPELTRLADILIVAIGKAHFVTAEMVKKGAVVIDVGINKTPSPTHQGSILVGDVDFESVKNRCSHITPVPGGVGPMTIAMLLSNTWKSYQQRLLSLLFLLFLMTGCQGKEEEISPITPFLANAMTIDYKILIGKSLSSGEQTHIQFIIDSTFEEVNAIYNKWNPESEISQLNQLKAGIVVPISPQLERFFALSQQIVEISNRRFDPTIEPLQCLWKQRLEQGEVPTKEEMERLMPAIGWDKIQFGNGLFCKAHDATSLDLSGIAKGYCVDLLVERLNQAGCPDVFVEWGGEIRAIGQHPNQRPWNIYIRRLEDITPAHAIAHLSLINQAIATSGDYLQNWKTAEGTCYFHIFDPETYTPLRITSSSIASVSVLASTCALADGLATAGMMFPTLEEAEAWTQTVKKKFPDTMFWLVARKL